MDVMWTSREKTHRSVGTTETPSPLTTAQWCHRVEVFFPPNTDDLWLSTDAGLQSAHKPKKNKFTSGSLSSYSEDWRQLVTADISSAKTGSDFDQLYLNPHWSVKICPHRPWYQTLRLAWGILIEHWNQNSLKVGYKAKPSSDCDRLPNRVGCRKEQFIIQLTCF